MTNTEQSEREREIRRNIQGELDRGGKLWGTSNHIQHLLSLLVDEVYDELRPYSHETVRAVANERDELRKRVQELQEYEDAEAKFMAKRGVLYNCTFIDGWAKVLDERDDLCKRVAELEGALRKIKQIANDTGWRSAFDDSHDIIQLAESLLSKEQK